jgi:hypothetical protein
MELALRIAGRSHAAPKAVSLSNRELRTRARVLWLLQALMFEHVRATLEERQLSPTLRVFRRSLTHASSDSLAERLQPCPPPQSHPEQRIKLLYHLLDLPSVPLAKMTNFGGRSTPTKRYRDDVAHGHAKLMRRSDSEFQAVIYEANGRQYICKRLSTLMSIPLLPFMNRSRWTCADNAPRSRID